MNKKLVIAGVVVLLCAVVGTMSLSNSVVPTVAFDKVASAGERVEVTGALDKHSIRSLRGANLVEFVVEEEVPQGDKKVKTGKRLTVLYDNPVSGLPANFPAASHARAAGTYDPTTGRLVADRVATKCPSKYEEKSLDLGTKSALKKWQNAIGEKSTSAAEDAAKVILVSD